MSTLSTFSEKERQYHQYQARQEYLREQRAIQRELEKTSRELLQAKLREEEALKREEAALAEIKRLKALLDKK